MNAKLDFLRAAGDPLALIPRDTQAGRAAREVDWAATSLGAPDSWSPALRSMVPFVIANRFPQLLWWGSEYVCIYNDSYIPILGTKHPWAMGRRMREVWAEVWEVLQPLIDTPFRGGPATWTEDIELELQRHGFVEECHFLFAYSPVPDETAPRGIGGVLATVVEITQKVINERRVAILRDLATHLAQTAADVDACVAAARLLEKHPKDVAFALVYLVDPAGERARLIGRSGLDEALAGPVEIDLTGGGTDAPWPVAQALRSEQPQTRTGLTGLPPLALGPSANAPHTVVVAPIKSHLPQQPAGALVVGVSPRIPLDDQYQGFIELAAAQIATAIANTRAYAEERRRAAALAEIDRVKTAFFSNVSHEFRTPLTLMLGPIEDALTHALPPATRAQLEVAQRNSLRLLKLVNSLLDFARIEAGRVQASYEPVDLAALTEDLASNFSSAMARAGLGFEVRCEAMDEPVFVDREMWEKIVLNLLSNAFKFTLSGSVALRLRADVGQALLEVSDTGVGIPAEELPHLFERFHRIEGTPARTHEGSGIGLALVQELVKLHGGSIAATSEAGRGTTFQVRIPLGHAHLPASRLRATRERRSTAISSQSFVQEALRWLPDSGELAAEPFAESPPPPDERFASTHGSRVLLADDNADMRAYVRDLLGPIYSVETAADGRQALDAARATRPDLVITDIMMPGLDGVGLLRALREDPSLRDVPVILLSARAGEEARIDGLNAGADDYVGKPFAARELLARAGALLELTRTRRDSEARFRAFVEATSEVVYRMNADWTEMRELRGRSFIEDTTDPSGSWLEKYIPADERPRVLSAIHEAVAEKKTFELEHRVLRAGGGIGWAFSRAIPLIDRDGNITEWFGAASNVTERRATQEALIRQGRELENAARHKDEFLAMLAHELRNPLAPIRNAGQFLLRQLPAEGAQQSAVHTIERQVTHLTRLVDDLLDVSRITRGRIELRKRPTAIADIVSRSLETVDPIIRRKQHRVAIVASHWRMIVNGDPERLVQCLSNVLTNAAKYTEPGGEIRIETCEANGEVIIAVIDNGVGMSAELLPKVFGLFVQGERTLDRSQGGLGIGLSIVKRVIEMHEGTVNVSSPGAGLGTRFEMRLPQYAGKVDQNPAEATGKSDSRRILVVDDNEDAASTLAMILDLEGHEVSTVFSGAEAIAHCEANAPDIVLLDIGLPGLDGYEVAARIRAREELKGVKLIAITGYGQESDRERARQAGFAGHLVKPVDFPDLKLLLDRLR